MKEIVMPKGPNGQIVLKYTVKALSIRPLKENPQEEKIRNWMLIYSIQSKMIDQKLHHLEQSFLAADKGTKNSAITGRGSKQQAKALLDTCLYNLHQLNVSVSNHPSKASHHQKQRQTIVKCPPNKVQNHPKDTNSNQIPASFHQTSNDGSGGRSTIKSSNFNIELPQICNRKNNRQSGEEESHVPATNHVDNAQLVPRCRPNVELFAELNQSSQSNLFKEFLSSSAQGKDYMYTYGKHVMRPSMKAKQNRCLKKPKLIKSQPADRMVLKKAERYFQDEDPYVDGNQVKELGLYDAVLRYKKNNVLPMLNEMKTIAIKKKVDCANICNKNELFLTNPKSRNQESMEELFKNELVIKGESSKEISVSGIDMNIPDIHSNDQAIERSGNRQQTIQRFELTTRFQLTQQLEKMGQSSHHTAEKDTILYHLTVQNYRIIEDEQYAFFRNEQYEDWSHYLSLFKQIADFLKEMKINFIKLRVDRLLGFWPGKKLTSAQIAKFLKIKLSPNKNELILKVYRMMKDRQTIRHVKQKQAKENFLTKWVWTRWKALKSIKEEKQLKFRYAEEIHKEFMKNPVWEVEIHLSSFSETQFLRNTTQYMEAFENNFCHLWKEDSKTFILILPAVNQRILRMFQNRLKLKRNITIICPQMHPLFPSSLSLAGNLLFSYEALNKIKRITNKRPAVLIPGRYSSPKYELLLSEHLNAPLLCSLYKQNSLRDQKNFFYRSLVDSPQYEIIPAKSTFQNLLEIFSELMMSNPKVSAWIFKIDGEFNGRGIATFKTLQSKAIRQILRSYPISKADIHGYLKVYLKLRIKINFQNCLFLVDEYFSTLCQKGGIIEAQEHECEIYSSCLMVLDEVKELGCFRTYNISYSNQSYLLCRNPPELLAETLKVIKENLRSQGYFGHITITIGIRTDQTLFGIDIKLYQTHTATVTSLIEYLDQNRNTVQSYCLESETIRNIIHSDSPKKKRFSKCHAELQYLYVPKIIFTDMLEENKATLIEDLMRECWVESSLKIYDQCQLYLSLGVSFQILLVGRDLKKMKKNAVEIIRKLTEKSNALRKYRGKQEVKDIFQFGHLIRALTQIKN